MAGVKLNDTLNQNKRIARYKKISKDFWKHGLKPDNFGGALYLPYYEDNEAWQETYKTKFSKEYKDWKNFRNKCFEAAEKEKSCTWLGGWCLECARQKNWGLEKRRRGES